jgi:SulP family sulfate permease
VQRSDGLRHDVPAGIVLGVQSVPDGLATGLLAGVNPLAGLYAYMVGTFTGALTASSQRMVIQGTGAMALLIADITIISDPLEGERALATLAVLTGIAMAAAAMLRLGAALRFVSNAVMVGFINAVGVNIVLGQLANVTGYAAEGSNRVVRAVNTVLSPSSLDWTSVAIGAATIALIVALERTRVGALGLVVGVVVTSAVVAFAELDTVATLDDLGVAANELPSLSMPALVLMPELLLPALALAFIGLVQGAAVAAAFPNPDGSASDTNRDFLGQGAANLASGVLQGMPVGGSVSASAIAVEAGARSRAASIVAAVVMFTVIVVFGDIVGSIAMPALGGLLMLIGVRTVRPDDLAWVWRTGIVQKTVLAVTFALTMVIPLQYAVLVGVGLSAVLFVVRQSNQIEVRRRIYDDGHVVEVDPPATLPAGEVVLLQPYGSLFYGAAPVFDEALPIVAPSSAHSVVIVRLRGRAELGSTFLDVLLTYAKQLDDVGSRLMVVSASDRIREQLELAGITAIIGEAGVRPGDNRVGAAAQRAVRDAEEWIASHVS